MFSEDPYKLIKSKQDLVGHSLHLDGTLGALEIESGKMLIGGVLVPTLLVNSPIVSKARKVTLSFDQIVKYEVKEPDEFCQYPYIMIYAKGV